jgi:hypothetical protein
VSEEDAAVDYEMSHTDRGASDPCEDDDYDYCGPQSADYSDEDESDDYCTPEMDEALAREVAGDMGTIVLVYGAGDVGVCGGHLNLICGYGRSGWTKRTAKHICEFC